MASQHNSLNELDLSAQTPLLMQVRVMICFLLAESWQRNSRKTLATVQGIADDYDKKKLVKAFKKKFACNGTVIEHPDYGEVIHLQGDQRKNIWQFLAVTGLAKDDQLKVHGF